jgi:hypothetical protein
MKLFVGEKCSDQFRLEFDFHAILEIFYMPQICDMGQLHTKKFTVRTEYSVFSVKSVSACTTYYVLNCSHKGTDYKNIYHEISGQLLLN